MSKPVRVDLSESDGSEGQTCKCLQIVMDGTVRPRPPIVPTYAPFRPKLEADVTYVWCACGRSKAQPFCDGSHLPGDPQPLRFRLATPEDHQSKKEQTPKSSLVRVFGGTQENDEGENKNSRIDERELCCLSKEKRSVTFPYTGRSQNLLCGCKYTGSPPFCDGSHIHVELGYEEEDFEQGSEGDK